MSFAMVSKWCRESVEGRVAIPIHGHRAESRSPEKKKREAGLLIEEDVNATNGCFVGERAGRSPGRKRGRAKILFSVV
jgi:hypothetical protein